MSNILDNDITSDSRPYVIELQGYLRAIQRARQGSTSVPQDGYYGPATTEACANFSKKKGYLLRVGWMLPRGTLCTVPTLLFQWRHNLPHPSLAKATHR